MKRTTSTTTNTPEVVTITNTPDVTTNNAPEIVTTESAADEIIKAITAPVVENTAYAAFISGLRSEGNRATMTAKVSESVLGMSLSEYKLVMADIADASVFLTAMITEGEHANIVTAENALYSRLSKAFAWSGQLVERSDLYFCAFHCLQLKRTKSVINEDGTTTSGTMTSTGKSLSGACKMVEILIGMRLAGYVWDIAHKEFRTLTQDQRIKMETRIAKFHDNQKKIESEKKTANDKSKSKGKGKKAA